MNEYSLAEIKDKYSLEETIDMTMEDFKTMCAKKNNGYLGGLENLLNLVYNNLLDIQKRLNKIEDEKRDDSYQKLLKDVEIKMITVASKVYVLRDIQKDRDANLKTGTLDKSIEV